MWKIHWNVVQIVKKIYESYSLPILGKEKRLFKFLIEKLPVIFFFSNPGWKEERFVNKSIVFKRKKMILILYWCESIELKSLVLYVQYKRMATNFMQTSSPRCDCGFHHRVVAMFGLNPHRTNTWSKSRNKILDTSKSYILLFTQHIQWFKQIKIWF